VASAYEQLPGEDGWPFVGSIPAFARRPLAFITELRREHGPMARFAMGDLDYVLLSDPEGIQQVLVTEHERFEKHEYLRFTLGDVVGGGLLAAEGEAWRRQRQLAQPDFRPERVRDYAPAMVAHAEHLLDNWAAEPERELHADMSHLALAIAAETLFGADVDEEAEAIGDALDDVMARFRADRRLMALVPKSWPLPANRRYHRGVETLHGIVDRLIDEHEPGGVDLVSRLIAAADETGAGLSRERLRDELVTFLLAGHETTALALTWTLWLLARHPDVQADAAAEIDAVLGDAQPTPEALEDLELLDAVVDESMRLLPPVWAFGRQSTEPVEIAGRPLPEGVQVMMSQWVVHRDPELWEQPTRFRPSRWRDGDADDEHRFAYFPFGGGPRTCIGDTFAGLEIRACLARILQAVHVETPLAERPSLDPSLTLRPGEPVLVRARSRETKK